MASQPSSALPLRSEISDPALIKMEEGGCGRDLGLTSSQPGQLPEGGSLVHLQLKKLLRTRKNAENYFLSIVHVYVAAQCFSVVSPSEFLPI